MKGGSCCYFEKRGKYCKLDGPYHTQKYQYQYVNLINGVYVFLANHALKHMDELDINCYMIEELRNYLMAILPKTTVINQVNFAGNSGVGNILGSFKKKTVNELNSTPYLCIDLTKTPSFYCVFNKFIYGSDTVIVIFALGKCNHTIEDDDVNYQYIYNHVPDYNNPADRSRLAESLSITKIEDIASFLQNSIKKSERLIESGAVQLLESGALQISTPQKIAPKSNSPQVTPSKSGISQTKKSQKKTKKQTQKKPQKKDSPELFDEFIVDKINPDELTLTDRIFDTILSSGDRKFNTQAVIINKNMKSKIAPKVAYFSTLIFMECHIPERMEISPKFSLVIFYKCTGFLPILQEDNISHLSLLLCDMNLDHITRYQGLKMLNICSQRGGQFDISKLSAELIELRACDLDLVNFKNINTSLNNLVLIRCSIDAGLERLTNLSNLIYIGERLPRLPEIDFSSCTILVDEVDGPCSLRLSPGNFRDIQEINNNEDNSDLPDIENIDVSTLIKFIGSGPFKFSPNLIWNNTTKKYCTGFSSFNLMFTLNLLDLKRDFIIAVFNNYPEISNILKSPIGNVELLSKACENLLEPYQSDLPLLEPIIGSLTSPKEVIVSESSPKKVIVRESSPEFILSESTSPKKVIVSETSPKKVIVSETSPKEVIVRGTSPKEVTAKKSKSKKSKTKKKN